MSNYLACGHQANTAANACAICVLLDPGATVQVEAPDLTTRTARCHCGRIEPSSKSADGSLAFFEYRGLGSRLATEQCKCGYYEIAHKYESGRVSPEPIDCKAGGFAPHGPHEFDSYYCGCDGWD